MSRVSEQQTDTVSANARNLERNRITLEEFAAAARQNQLDSLNDVRRAVLRTNRRISFIPKCA